MTSFVLLTPPAIEPVSLPEAKSYLRIDTDANDALVQSLIAAARKWAESYTNRAFITQTWKLSVDMIDVDARWINLPKAPLQNVIAVELFDETGIAQPWPESNYRFDTATEPGRLALRLGRTWPAQTRHTDSLSITFAAGYGSHAQNVPDPIRAAIHEVVANMYQNRGDAITPSLIPHVACALLAPYRFRYTGVR